MGQIIQSQILEECYIIITTLNVRYSQMAFISCGCDLRDQTSQGLYAWSVFRVWNCPVPNYAPGHKPNISGSRRPRALTAAAFTLGLVED